jgi:antitoxin component of RelBE/YafQ-DinJ toxin-antitoxin module
MVRREAVAGRVDPAVKRGIKAAIEEAGIDESEFVRRSVATYFRENPDNLELL